MFQVERSRVSRGILLAIGGLLVLSLAAMGMSIWLIVELEKEQQVIQDLVRRLPPQPIQVVLCPGDEQQLVATKG